jgi:hypothetical protein
MVLYGSNLLSVLRDLTSLSEKRFSLRNLGVLCVSAVEFYPKTNSPRRRGVRSAAEPQPNTDAHHDHSVMRSVPSRGSVGSMPMQEAVQGKAQAIRYPAAILISLYDAHH